MITTTATTTTQTAAYRHMVMACNKTNQPTNQPTKQNKHTCSLLVYSLERNE
jgi:hypothetical protein